MTKYFLVAVIIIALIALAGCMSRTVVVGEQQTYDVASDINSLNIEINAVDLVIEHGDKFSVESNLKNLTVSEQDGVLKLVEKTKYADSYNGAMLKLCVPDDIAFEDVVISTGAGRLTVDSLSTDTMKLNTGAGKAEFGSLDVNSKIKIKGGAGEVNILDGTLNNLSLSLGVGELNMTAQLLGKSDFQFGVGESKLTLIGSKDDYSFDIKQGVGKITIDNSSVSSVGNTNGQNVVTIKGGVGATDISFRK